MPSNLEELINVEESQPQERKETRGPGRQKGSTNKKKEEKQVVLTEEEEQELTRKKDILVSVATLGELEQLTGEKMSSAKIRLLPKDRAEAMFNVYQSKLGQEMTDDSMEAIVSTTVKLAAWLVTFDDEEALKQDLMKNKQLRRMLGVKAAGVAEKYGDFVAWGRVAFDFVRHIKMPDKEPENEALQPVEINLDEKKKE